MSPDKENANHPSASAFAPQPSKNSRKSPESGSQSDARALQAGKRRRAAADWIEALTGVAVSATSDRHFRESLKDGTLLCQVLNIIRPGCITQVKPTYYTERSSPSVESQCFSCLCQTGAHNGKAEIR